MLGGGKNLWNGPARRGPAKGSGCPSRNLGSHGKLLFDQRLHHSEAFVVAARSFWTVDVLSFAKLVHVQQLQRLQGCGRECGSLALSSREGESPRRQRFVFRA